MAEVLKDLLRDSDESALLAYQIAFDLVESEHQHFIMEVNKHLPQKARGAGNTKDASGEQGQEQGMETGEESTGSNDRAATATSATVGAAAEGASGMEVDGEAGGAESEEFPGRMDKLRQVLVEGFGIDLSLNFLYKMNRTDLLLMKNIKGALETRNSVLHNATVVAHGYMQAGTTVSASVYAGANSIQTKSESIPRDSRRHVRIRRNIKQNDRGRYRGTASNTVCLYCTCPLYQ